MKKARPAAPFFLRGLTVQLFFVSVLPLTLFLLVIAFGSVSLHQRDMRTLLGERDERAVRSVVATLEAELYHSQATITAIGILADNSEDPTFQTVLASAKDLTSDFDGGMAFLSPYGSLRLRSGQESLWECVASHAAGLELASSSNPGPLIWKTFPDPVSKQTFVIISAFVPGRLPRREKTE